LLTVARQPGEGLSGVCVGAGAASELTPGAGADAAEVSAASERIPGTLESRERPRSLQQQGRLRRQARRARQWLRPRACGCG